MGVADYSTTPASNITINSIGIQGTNSPANFDNAFRQLMADIATARTDGALASMPYAAKSSGYTLAETDRGKLIDCTAAVEIELLAVATAGAGFYFVAKANGGAVTLDPNGTENINGSSTSATVADGSSALVVCNGSAWFTVTIGGGNVTTTGTQTLTNKTLTGAALNGTLGATTPSTVAGTTGTFSGAVSGTTGTFSGAVSGTTGTFSNTVTVATNVQSSGTNLVLGSSAGGGVYLRPEGIGSATNQMVVDDNGDVTINGTLTVTG